VAWSRIIYCKIITRYFSLTLFLWRRGACADVRRKFGSGKRRKLGIAQEASQSVSHGLEEEMEVAV
jgi:hypothetical protein